MHLSLLGKAFLVAAGAYAVSRLVQPAPSVVYVQTAPPQPHPFQDLLFSLAKKGDLFGFIQVFDACGFENVSISKRMTAYDDWQVYIAKYST